MTNTSPSRATRSRTSPGELRSSIIFRVLKSIFMPPSVLDLGAGPGAPVAAPHLVLVQPLRRTADHESEVVHAWIPHRRMQIAEGTALIPMRRRADSRRVDKDPRHLVRIVVGEADRDDILLPGDSL